MGREKKRGGFSASLNRDARERFRAEKKARKHRSLPLSALDARRKPPSIKSKHQFYYELVDNKEKKKKKLEYTTTSDVSPPPGFEFLPAARNLELTKACKEISRDLDAMIFIVSTDKHAEQSSLSKHVNRIGYHFRQTIMEQARALLGDRGDLGRQAPGIPEPIPESQEEINAQADKAIQELFPRIPNTDRQTIIEHSFKKGATKKGEPLVGLAKDITLSRRVQLAVLAHIRHVHTRYDELLNETTYVNARKAVEELSLEILVKWRGDEENGRDQLDEILREVIVISDSEDSDNSDEDDDGEESDSTDGDGIGHDDDENSDDSYDPETVMTMPDTVWIDGSTGNDALAAVTPPGVVERGDYIPEALQPVHAENAVASSSTLRLAGPSTASQVEPAGTQYPRHAENRTDVKKGRRGFNRYQAALASRWDRARDHVRQQAYRSGEQHPVLHDEPLGFDNSHTQSSSLYRAAQDSIGSHYYARAEERPRGFDYGVPIQIAANGDESARTMAGPSMPQIYDTRTSSVPPTVPPDQVSSMGSQRVVSGSYGPRDEASNYGPGRHITPQRILVRSEQAQDHLVPSVEPLSPALEQPASVPVFIRTVSPRQSRPPEPYHAGVHGPYTRCSSSDWADDDRAFDKRRRLTNEEGGFIQLSPRQGISQQQQILVHENVQRAHMSMQRPLQENMYQEPPTQSFSRMTFGEPLLLDERRLYADSNGALADVMSRHNPGATTFAVANGAQKRRHDVFEEQVPYDPRLPAAGGAALQAAMHQQNQYQQFYAQRHEQYHEQRYEQQQEPYHEQLYAQHHAQHEAAPPVAPMFVRQVDPNEPRYPAPAPPGHYGEAHAQHRPMYTARGALDYRPDTGMENSREYYHEPHYVAPKPELHPPPPPVAVAMANGYCQDRPIYIDVDTEDHVPAQPPHPQHFLQHPPPQQVRHPHHVYRE